MTKLAHTPTTTSQAKTHTDTENDRFKRSFGDWIWVSMTAATVLHFGMFALWPTFTVEALSKEVREPPVYIFPELPDPREPPKPIEDPAPPIVSEPLVLGRIEVVSPPIRETPPVVVLAPPTEDTARTPPGPGPAFTPMTVRPEIKNKAEVVRAMEREYPAIIRDAGIGGLVSVWFFIDEEGRVQDKRLAQSSGHASLDEAAMKVADIYRFSPALNRDQRVAVWVQFTITFRVR